MTTLIIGLNSLLDEATAYKDLLTRDEFTIKIEIILTDTSESATLVIGQHIILEEGSHEPDLRLTMESDTFNAILEGEADFGALIGRSKLSDSRPINIQFLNPDKSTEIIDSLYTLMTVFFTPGRVKLKKLNEEMAGEAHGAHPIPLVYWNGIRYAWYLVKKGETLNESGESDPYPQVLTVVNGKGTVIIGKEIIEVSSKTVIYIPTNTIHQITAHEDLELMWMAWKTPLQ